MLSTKPSIWPVYADLQSAYGHDLKAATDHYIRYGMREERTDVDLHPSSSVALELAIADMAFNTADQFVM